MEHTCDSLQFVIDSLLYITENTSKIANNSTPTNSTLFFAILESGVIVLLFIIERLITYFSSRKLRKIEFFQEIVVKPNIDRIVNFFSLFFKNLKTTIEEISSYKGTSDEIDNLKANKLFLLKEEKVKFDHEFLSLVRSVDRRKSTNLTHILNSLEDVATVCLSNRLSEIDLSDIESKTSEVKAKFFEQLYRTTSKAGNSQSTNVPK
ncbi:MAG: hypothetical protein KDD14_22320 [Saprospiraceae bacterium]|nr:hypothetical protein [Saprospiraceae bacterium]